MSRRTLLIRGILFLSAALVLLGIGLLLIRNDENNQNKETRSSMSNGFGQLRRVTIEGTNYREKPAVTTLLIVGIDKTDSNKEIGPDETYRSGGQADFIMLVAFDHTSKTIHQVQIDRDTMSEIDILGIFGNEVGTRTEQICLSHSFGETPRDNARYTVRAVERLLSGLDIDGYYMIDYGEIGKLNDALGGVPVKVLFDMTSINPEWTEGAEITLKGKEAEQYVRARMTIGSGTNQERMIRQSEFMKNAIERLKSRIKEDVTFTESLLNQLTDKSTTNMPVRQLSEEVYKSRDYKIMDVDHLEGDYVIGEDGYVEFHLKEGAAVQWVLEHLYEKEK